MSTSVNIFRNTHFASSSGGGKEEQTKSVTITENGTTTVTPDEGKTLSSVTVNTEVEGGGQTIVSAVGKAVYEYDYIDGQWQWDQIQPVGDNIKSFILSNDEDHDISVTVDGNEPQEGNPNVLFGCFTNRGDTLNGIYFRIEIEGEVFDAEIQVSTSPTE